MYDKVQNVDIENNTLVLFFSDNQPFNANILVDTQSSFEQLDRFKMVYVKTIGNIPLEMLAYLIEVSKYCTMNLEVDDEKGFTFMKQLKEHVGSNVKIKYVGEKNGS